MHRITTGLFCLLFSLILTLPAVAQDPLTGTWTGDWGPSPGDRNQVTLELKWDGKALSGSVMPPNGKPIPIQKSSFDAKTGAVHFEADAPGRGGAPIHYVVDGKVTGNSMSGAWTHDNRKGDFKLTKK